jgi:hypothetical protein
MMTFLVLAFLGVVAAVCLFVIMLPLMLIGTVLRILTLPFRLLFRPLGFFRPWGHRYGYGYGAPWGGGWGGPRWRHRGPFSRW